MPQGPTSRRASHRQRRGAAWTSALGLLLTLGLAVPPHLAAAGTPFLRRYEPGGHPQYWAIAEDPRGVMLIGSGDGLLEFDGVAWRLWPLPRRGAVRSLAVAEDGTLYTGSQGDFGLFRVDAAGVRRFDSLLDSVAPDERAFGDVWKTYATAEGVYFQASDRLFRWANGALRSWPPEKSFHFSYVVDGVFYVQEASRGLLRMRGDRLEPVPGGERLSGERLYAMLPFGDGRVLVGTREHGLFAFDARAETDTLAPFASEVDALLREHSLYHAASPREGQFLLATLSGGLLAVDAKGRLLARFDRASGLLSDRVNYVYRARDGALWLAHEGSLDRLEIGGPFTRFPLRVGESTILLSLAELGDRLYAGTTRGLMVLEPRRPGGGALHPVPGITTQVFSLRPYAGVLLVATAEGVDLLAGERVLHVAPGTSNVLELSQRRPGRLYVGQIGGLRRLEADPARPTLWRDAGLLPGLHADVRTIFETASGDLWLGTRAHGVWRVRPADDGVAPARLERFDGVAAGMAAGSVDVWRLGERPVFSAADGLYRFDETSGRFAPEAWFGSGRPLFLSQDTRGRIWVASQPAAAGGAPPGYRIELFAAGDPPRRLPASDTLRRLGDAALHDIAVDRDGVAWMATRSGLVRFDPEAPPPPVPQPYLPICRVAVGDTAPPDEARNAVHFECALPAFADERRNEFRFRLDGSDESWSPWRADHRGVFAGLLPGRFTLRVQGRDAYGRESGEARASFEITPPWYRTWIFLVGASLLALVAAAGAHRARVRRLERRQNELEAVVTERTRALRASEQRLRQAQKMEAVRQLAAGVAHGFNNLLTVICGHAEMLLAQRPADDQREPLLAIDQASQRAAALTRQLVAFSGQQALTTEQVDVNALIRAHATALRDALGPQIELECALAGDLWPVQADLGQIEQLLTNLALNARDAMPAGGRFTITTWNATVDGETSRSTVIGVPRGDYVALRLADTGHGMAPETLERIFEPFFTTKEFGAGLGLSVVDGVVRQCGGRITARSAPGEGARFSIYLPRAVDIAPAPGGPAAAASTPPHSTILLVEDEPAIRTLITKFLSRAGYDVLAAACAEEALALWRAQAARIDLLVTDVLLPNVSGSELAKLLRAEQPGLRLLFVTGYSANLLSSDPELEDAPVIEKPFSPSALLARVREILAARDGG